MGEILFEYKIENTTVKVLYTDWHEKDNDINDAFYKGVTEAISEYLFYPPQVISPRVKLFSVEFELENMASENENHILEQTKKAFLEFMENSPENAQKILPKYVVTPDLDVKNVDKWCENIRKRADETHVDFHITQDEFDGLFWVKFEYGENFFYGRYRDKGSKTLLVSLPGYNSEWNDLLPYIDGDYDILHISPLGYNTPTGFNNKKRVRGTWPVLYDTVTEITENSGYNEWFFEACLAIKAARKPEQNLVFLGTSQGGAASLILTSVFNDCAIACASEMPFLIGFSDYNYDRVRNFVADQINNPEKMIYDFYARERFLCIDPLVHSSRIKCPTLLIAGELDKDCLPEDIYRLYQVLNCKKEYVELKNQVHGFSDGFKVLAKKWIMEVL